jgi:KUP system potassium uptake protein
VQETTARNAQDPVRLAVIVGALGVVFGDIGTSPIYTLQTLFKPSDPHPVQVSEENVYGVVSLVFWSVMIIVTITYVLLAMRIDNHGDGGILALITLVRRMITSGGGRTAAILATVGIFGAALFFGDSIVTPAISVLSAIEGLDTVEPSFTKLVVPLTAVILVLLFVVQRHGSGVVGRFFGPVMFVWFLAVAITGIFGIFRHPQILQAISPTYALNFLIGHFGTAFFALAAVVLTVTGAEALYADLGDFGRRAITRAWLALVFPALILNYFGQGALILENKANISAPFFNLVPESLRLVMVLLATVATVIASQAVITGAFALTSQAAQLGYLPRLRISHTSVTTRGQIYVPQINWLLLIGVLTLVFAFRSSSGLAYAYGMAVTGTITITTLLFFYVARSRWRTPIWVLASGAVLLLTVDLLFVGANLTKLTHGAWLPLLIAVVAFTILTTWQRGREIVTAQRERNEGSLREFVEDLRSGRAETRQVDGTAIFLNRGKATAPLAFRANVTHNHVRHEHVVILSIETEQVPYYPEDQRLAVDNLEYADDGIIHVTAKYGYAEKPDVPAVLRMLGPDAAEGPLDIEHASYFLSKIELGSGPEPTMARWRKRLFIATSHFTADAAGHFGLPREGTVILGSNIDV